MNFDYRNVNRISFYTNNYNNNNNNVVSGGNYKMLKLRIEYSWSPPSNWPFFFLSFFTLNNWSSAGLLGRHFSHSFHSNTHILYHHPWSMHSLFTFFPSRKRACKLASSFMMNKYGWCGKKKLTKSGAHTNYYSLFFFFPN